MVALKELQNNFQQYLMGSDEDQILPSIAPDDLFSAANRLRVYHDAYRIRLCEVLKLDFIKVHTLLGDEAFDNAFAAYIDRHPSQHFSVRYFGQHFCEFLEKTPPFNEHPAVAEMARFEWSVNFTLDAADSAIVSKEDLAALAPQLWPYTRFKFHPSVISAVFHWDTAQLWQLIDSDSEPRPPQLQSQGMRWIFWRKKMRSYFQSCQSAEEIMFHAIQQGKDFSAMCEDLMAVMDEDAIPLFAAQTLYKWVNEDMISELEILEDPSAADA